MARFSKSNGVFHRLFGAHLTNHNDIGSLAEHVLKCHLETNSINADFALSNHATGMRVYKFNRVLNADDMAMTIVVSVANH